jgi:hypothetical protein
MNEAEMKGPVVGTTTRKKISGQQNNNDSIEPGLTYILRATPARC